MGTDKAKGSVFNRTLPIVAVVAFSLLGCVYRPPAKSPTGDPPNSGSVAWMLTSSALVLLMTPGLSFFYGGLVKKKNIVATIMHCFVTISVVTLLWILVGFSLIFGESLGGFWGNPATYFMIRNVDGDTDAVLSPQIPLLLFCVFQLMFAIISAAIVTGAFAERINFRACVLFSAMYLLLIYCPVGHWVMNPKGFMHAWGVIDFAGGYFVHMTSGFTGLATTFCVRQRADRTAEPANIGFVILGTSILWFGWFGFNSGSALMADALATQAFATTQMAAACAMIAWNALESFFNGKPTAIGACFGTIVGLVAITPCAGYVSVGSSFAIGTIAVGCSFGVARLIHHYNWVDDTLDVFACHGVGGLVGALCNGIFARQASGKLFGYQLLAAVIVGAWSAGMSFLIMKLIGLVTPLAVTEEQEAVGLDAAFTGEKKKTIESIVMLAAFIENMDVEGARSWIAAESSKENSDMLRHVHEALESILANLERFKPYLPDALFAVQEGTTEFDKEVIPPDFHPFTEEHLSEIRHSREFPSPKAEFLEPIPTPPVLGAVNMNIDLGLGVKRCVVASVLLFPEDTAMLTYISSTFIECLFDNVTKVNGTVHSFSGTHALISWGAVSTTNDSAVSACRCLSNVRRQLSHTLIGTRVLAAVHLDRALVGNVGTNRKRTFHIDRDLTSFVEDLAKFNNYIGSGILVTDAVHDFVAPYFKTKGVDRLACQKSSGEEVKRIIFSLEEELEIDNEEWMYQLRQVEDRADPAERQYREAFKAFVLGDFNSAKRLFMDLKEMRMVKLAKCMVDSGVVTSYSRKFGHPWHHFDGETGEAARSTSVCELGSYSRGNVTYSGTAPPQIQ